MEELVDLILKINQEVRNEVPYINHGGCGVFASLMYKHLKSLGYDPKIVILTMDWESSFESKKETLNKVMNNQSVQRGDLRHTSFAHCCIEVSGLYFDGTRLGTAFLNYWNECELSGNYSIEELDLALKIGGWNKQYSRRKKNPTVKKIIKNATKQVYFT